MKLRKFYPQQVYRRLSGAHVSDLDAGKRRALSIATNVSRKMDIVVTVVDGRIAVHTARELGRMMLTDLQEMVRKTRASGAQFGTSLPDPPEFLVANVQSLAIRREMISAAQITGIH